MGMKDQGGAWSRSLDLRCPQNQNNAGSQSQAEPRGTGFLRSLQRHTTRAPLGQSKENGGPEIILALDTVVSRRVSPVL